MKKSILAPLLFLFLALIFSASTIDLNNLYNYSQQNTPNYITKNNQPANNTITNRGATLGRVLFYDKKLSLNNSISCSSCHKQQFAFSDTAKLSIGLNRGLTGRHSMRLINSRFATETRFFWDERANTLESQTTQPIRDHIEMGFSGNSGQPSFDSLISKLGSIDYYQTLFSFVYGTSEVTENKIQFALAQFIRSIQSFDSKFDIGRVQVGNDAAPFPNYSNDENAGKQLFLASPPQGGAGCQGCHKAPEFDIDPNSRNNGVIGVANNPGQIDLLNTRAPSLRDLFNPNGTLNGPLMHNGNFTNIQMVINHYNAVPNNPNNNNLDPRLAGPGGNLQLTNQQKNQLEAFLRTLTGSDVYTNPKWSDPFDEIGNINIVPVLSQAKLELENVDVFPNPSTGMLNFRLAEGSYKLEIFNISGQLIHSENLYGNNSVDLSNIVKGVYFIKIKDLNAGLATTKKIVLM